LIIFIIPLNDYNVYKITLINTLTKYWCH